MIIRIRDGPTPITVYTPRREYLYARAIIIIIIFIIIIGLGRARGLDRLAIYSRVCALLSYIRVLYGRPPPHDRSTVYLGGVPDTTICAHILIRIYLYLGARVLIISIVIDI